jgi:hypothetical protein
MTQSRFINLTPYCIVEYMFEPLGSTNFISDDIVLLENSDTNISQIFNEDISYSTTKNIKDITVVPIGNNKVAYLDSEKVPNYIDYNTSINETSINGYNIVYDNVRFHFITGFDFEGFEALILSIRNIQNDGDNFLFANILLAPETIAELITFNSKPLFLSDSLYDRYIDIKVPSIKNVNNEYITALNQSTTFAANITPNGTGGSTGFIDNAPIQINLSECARREKLATNVNIKYDIFEISENYNASVSQTNEFDNVGTFINEAVNGDYIEYYLTFNAGFPEELLSILNNRNPNNDWIIIHQLSVFEQVGSAFINTTRQIVFQEDNWDEPLVFRPVLKNAGSAVSMSIDLLSRLTNRLNGEQIIREASFSMLSPKKYGKKLNVIPLSDEPQSQKVYNKIIKNNFEATKLFIEPTFAPGFEGEAPTAADLTKTLEYVPVFFSNNNISVSNGSGKVSIRDNADEVIFGPGQLKFVLSPFDNSIKIKMFNILNKKAIPLDLNLNDTKFRMIFETSGGNIKVDNTNSDRLENLSTGELMFNINKNDAETIMKSVNQTVYITSVSQLGDENLMYTGEWRRPAQQSDVDSAIEQAKIDAGERENRESTIAELQAKIEKIAADANKKKYSISRNSKIKKKGIASVVNRIGMPNPKKIKTNVSNAGKKSKKSTEFSNLAKKIK